MSQTPIYHGLKLVWGDGLVPPLPDDWTLIRRRLATCLAVSPDGTEYFISDRLLYPRRIWPQGTWNPGQEYVDTNSPIPFPTPPPPATIRAWGQAIHRESQRTDFPSLLYLCKWAQVMHHAGWLRRHHSA